MIEFDSTQKNILYIIFLITFFLFLYTLIFVIKYSAHIKENWLYYRDKPYIMPFAGIIHRERGEGILFSTIQNFKKVIWGTFKKYFNWFMTPIKFIIKVITKILKQMRDTLNIFRTQAKIMRNLFKKLVEETAERLTRSYSAIQYLQEKIKLTLRRQQALFQLLMHYVTALQRTMKSFQKGPIPTILTFMSIFAVVIIFFIGMCIVCAIPLVGIWACPICAVCFQGNTSITMQDGAVKCIKDLVLGDNLHLGGNVNLLLKMQVSELSGIEMYNYGGVIVSGSHLVHEDKWVRVEDSNRAIPMVYKDEYIYCLNSEYHKIYSKGHVFSDYFETSEPDVCALQNRLIMNDLNKKEPITYEKVQLQDSEKTTKKHLYTWSFDKNTLVKLTHGVKKISELQIGDITNSGKVLAIIKCLSKHVIMYKYRQPKSTQNSIILSGTQAILEEGTWIRAYQSKYSKPIRNYKKKIIYSVITESSRLEIFIESNISLITTDFQESNSEINNIIDQLSINNLNNLI